jgi:pimeloyl-ACP methyl ester carboxylesterase
VLDAEMLPCSIGGFDAVCGRLTVPEDRGRPAARQIELNVAVVPAASQDPASDPVFFLAGGPGGASTEWTSVPSTFPAIHADRDIVLVDQRGTGGSNALFWPDPPDVVGLSDAQIHDVLGAWLMDALRQMDADHRFYTSAAAADDLDDVRSALGYDRINLYGGSYGATLAQYYVRQHEPHVRTVVLDGGTLLDVPIFEVMPTASQAALDAVFARCLDDEACSTAFPDPAGDLAATLERLTRRPAETGVPDPWSEEPIVVDASTLVGLIHELIVTNRSGEVPRLIHLAAVRDYESLAELLAQISSDPGTDPSRLVMNWSILCSEAWARSDQSRIAAASADSYFGEVATQRARDFDLGCSLLPTAFVPPNDAAPLRSDIPVLLLNGSEDPQDPPANVSDAQIELPNSLSIVAPAQGHTVGHLGCLPDVVAAFIAAGSVDGLDTACVQEMSPPPFDTRAV